MKNQLIRKLVFETNSSSCHSITVDNSMELNDIPLPDNNGIITIQSEEFGWEISDYSDFYSKAAYVAIYIRDWGGDNKETFKK